MEPVNKHLAENAEAYKDRLIKILDAMSFGPLGGKKKRVEQDLIQICKELLALLEIELSEKDKDWFKMYLAEI